MLLDKNDKNDKSDKVKIAVKDDRGHGDDSLHALCWLLVDGWWLFHFPGVAGKDEVAQGVKAFLGADGLDLFLDSLVVGG